MSDGGKGSKPRPFTITREHFSENWDMIFKQSAKDNTGVSKNEYYDILSTEDCFPDDIEDDDE